VACMGAFPSLISFCWTLAANHAEPCKSQINGGIVMGIQPRTEELDVPMHAIYKQPFGSRNCTVAPRTDATEVIADGNSRAYLDLGRNAALLTRAEVPRIYERTAAIRYSRSSAESD
jgi:hypothetical protein